MNKVLATVAHAVYKFTEVYRDYFVIFKGTDKIRTRKYQMSISFFLDDLSKDFEIFGFINGEGFIPFRKGRNYDWFLIKRKETDLEH